MNFPKVRWRLRRAPPEQDLPPDALVASSFYQRVLAAQKRERDQLLREMVKMRGLMPLLMKPRNGEHWSAIERTELQDQLRAIAHVSPYLVVMVLPGSFAVLPVLAWWLDRRRQDRDDSPPAQA
jgi:hypothetical protein